jgi:hypothetical protein
MIDMITLMENVEWIGSDHIGQWCNEDRTRHTLLSKALSKNLAYTIEDNDIDPQDVIDEYRKKYPRDELTSKTDILLDDYCIKIAANVFKQWYYSIWPPEETVESHMSTDLAIAVQCSRELYNGGDLAEKSAPKQNKEIRKWLKETHPEIQGKINRSDRIRLIVTHAP